MSWRPSVLVTVGDDRATLEMARRRAIEGSLGP